MRLGVSEEAEVGRRSMSIRPLTFGGAMGWFADHRGPLPLREDESSRKRRGLRPAGHGGPRRDDEAGSPGASETPRDRERQRAAAL